MPTPGEHKTVQARILDYAEAIGWTFVPREEAEKRRGFDPDAPPTDRAGGARSLFFDELLGAKVHEFNPRYSEAAGALLGAFRHLQHRHLRQPGIRRTPAQPGQVLRRKETAERDLVPINHEEPANNVFEVTEEWAFHNGRYGTREDVVPSHHRHPGALVIECKNANKDEAIALGGGPDPPLPPRDPELFVSQQLFTASRRYRLLPTG